MRPARQAKENIKDVPRSAMLTRVRSPSKGR